METVLLNNGIKMPIIGYGTYYIPSHMAEKCVSDAIHFGYRSIDTAQSYGNEREVGLACRNSGIPRSEFFITTKLWGCRGYADTLRSIEGSLRRLDMDYIDLLLMHEPGGDVHEIYRAMESAYQDGKVRAIGISNFMEDNYLDLIDHCQVIPAVNQVETHVFRQQAHLRELESKNGTKHESWSPLACGKNGIWHNPVLLKISQNHNKDISHIALRFLIQQGIIVIPKNVRIERMVENLKLFDFELDDEEMREIAQLEEGRSLFNWW